jgi:HPt (histidine-containing phosphotransfer) domain-containing protein
MGHHGDRTGRTSEQLDVERIAGLQRVMGIGFGGLVESLVSSMEGAIDQLETALAGGGLEQATQAAHRCRNDALMIGASELLDALAYLESAARNGRLAVAKAAFSRVQSEWPKIREQLELLARTNGQIA